MKSSFHRRTPVVALLVRALRALQEALGSWAPRPVPRLVPIPIRVERPVRDAAARYRGRGG